MPDQTRKPNRPTDEQAVLLNKTAHLDLFFKPLYEAYADIHLLGVYFYADGDGATRLYPGLFPVPIGCYEPCVPNANALTCADAAAGTAAVCAHGCSARRLAHTATALGIGSVQQVRRRTDSNE